MCNTSIIYCNHLALVINLPQGSSSYGSSRPKNKRFLAPLDSRSLFIVYFNNLWLPDLTLSTHNVRTNFSSILDHFLEWSKKKYGNLT